MWLILFFPRQNHKKRAVKFPFLVKARSFRRSTGVAVAAGVADLILLGFGGCIFPLCVLTCVNNWSKVLPIFWNLVLCFDSHAFEWIEFSVVLRATSLSATRCSASIIPFRRGPAGQMSSLFGLARKQTAPYGERDPLPEGYGWELRCSCWSDVLSQERCVAVCLEASALVSQTCWSPWTRKPVLLPRRPGPAPHCIDLWVLCHMPGQHSYHPGSSAGIQTSTRACSFLVNYKTLKQHGILGDSVKMCQGHAHRYCAPLPLLLAFAPDRQSVTGAAIRLWPRDGLVADRTEVCVVATWGQLSTGWRFDLEGNSKRKCALC